jgi:hypothetical protein
LSLPVSGSTVKKVVVERFDREKMRGFVSPQTFLLPGGLELLSQDGSLAQVPYEQIKAVSFVRDPEGPGVLAERRTFLARPKTAGLWIELRFRDGELLEGVLPNNLQALDGSGYTLSPPEAAGNAQRVFVPRQALAEVSVLGVVGGKRKRPESVSGTQQIRLFSEE